MLVLSFATAGVAAAATTPEFKPVPAKKKFTGSGNGIKSSFNDGSETLTCTGSSVTGELTSARGLGKVGLVLTGCESSGAAKSGCAVNSSGAKAGEIEIKPLGAELGTVASGEAATGVGLRLKPETKTAWFTLVENGCTGESVVSGTVAAEVATVGKKQVGNELSFKVTSHQAIEKIALDSGTLEDPALTAFASGMTLGGSDAVTFEEAVEVT
jgi:hypothetical protein